jgi:hypothetical protein
MILELSCRIEAVGARTSLEDSVVSGRYSAVNNKVSICIINFVNCGAICVLDLSNFFFLFMPG